MYISSCWSTNTGMSMFWGPSLMSLYLLLQLGPTCFVHLEWFFTVGPSTGVKINQSICFKWGEAISTLRNRPLKCVEKFTHLGNSDSFTESDVYNCLATTGIAVDLLSVIQKSDQSNNKTGFLPSCGCVHATVWMHHVNANKTHWKSSMGTTQDYYKLFWTNPGRCKPQNNSCTATYLPSHVIILSCFKFLYEKLTLLIFNWLICHLINLTECQLLLGFFLC